MTPRSRTVEDGPIVAPPNDNGYSYTHPQGVAVAGVQTPVPQNLEVWGMGRVRCDILAKSCDESVV